MNLSWDVDREGGVSLVRCRVRNGGAVPRRVRIESRLDGPVLPPRRGGLPETGWDESGVTLRLGPGERRALGFATRAPPVDPPVEVAEVEAVDPTEQSGDAGPGGRADGPASATADALRRLGDSRPPRDAIASGATGLGEATGAGEATGLGEATGAGEATGLGEATGAGEADSKGRSSRSDHAAGNGADAVDSDEPASDPDAPAPPPGETTGWSDAVGARLDAVEERIDRAERLTDADLATATAAVAEADGVAALSGLDERVAADAKRLSELSERAAALAARAEATDAPVEALERLA
ncbi:DUF7857 domain-containing protein [Halorubrum lipolyticum]|uniref:DUF8080 domain-containing protein n=1 Tax=Halorubrum lipolyticum DSM 21995 TaxID=1227482 RepID=M0NUC7_9EURY|nr:hypothetical protein [Halorubrum lipolyticum]EMA60220.1 hypothetical protein C469_09150 [Halorubrum lipolyticum DSM 21995]